MNRGAVAMKKWRESRKLSQDAAARQVGIGQSSWGRYELGERIPGGQGLKKVCTGCEIDPNLFMQEIDMAALAAMTVAGAQPVVSSLLETPAGAPSRAPAAFSQGGGHD